MKDNTADAQAIIKERDKLISENIQRESELAFIKHILLFYQSSCPRLHIQAI